MPRTELGDLAAFLTVARERSFTRAAAQLGDSQIRAELYASGGWRRGSACGR